MGQKLKQDFFLRETIQTAADLLGCVMVRVIKDGLFLKGKIVETEAYLGAEDPCCHSYRGRMTKRTQVMYRQGGCAYVYFTYGMYYCLNAVTEKAGIPNAVLIRALEPLEGAARMQRNRKQTNIYNLTSGPGKLCQALQITKEFNGESLFGNVLYIESGKKIPENSIVEDKRIGLPQDQPASLLPLRFYIKDSPYVSCL